MTGPQYRGRTRQIIKLARTGMIQAEIARTLSCTPQNVCMAVKRHGIEVNLKGPPLTPKHIDFIEAEAKAAHVDFNDMARAMLCDYLEENVSREPNS